MPGTLLARSFAFSLQRSSGQALRNSAMQITLSAGHTTHHPQKESWNGYEKGGGGVLHCTWH